MINLPIILLLGLGILLGLIIGNATFRKKFFVGLRHFIGGKRAQKKDTGIVRKLIECPKCGGLGRNRSPDMRTGYRWEKCVYCNGTGEVEARK